MIRLTDTCELQESTDGGATWATIDGWDSNALSCFVGPPGVPGTVGPIGPTGPGVPVPLPGQSTTDLACSISGYLASQVIKEAVQFVVDGINGSQSTVEILAGFLAAVFLGPEGVVPVVGGINALYGLVEGGTIADYEAALTDTTLWSDVTCAIYNATSGTGYVNDDNFADVLTNVAAITYAHPAVVSSIVSYLTAGGAIYLEAAQLPGALAVVDCSGCTGYCQRWDFTATDAPWSIVPGQDGSYVPTAGFEAVSDTGRLEVDIWYTFTGSPAAIDTVVIECDATTTDTGGFSFVRCYTAADFSAHDDFVWAPSGTGPTVNSVVVSEVAAYAVWIRLNVQPDTANTAVINAVRFEGPGADPFGSTNC